MRSPPRQPLDPEGAASLLSADSVRQRCGMIFAHVEAGRSPDFTLDLAQLDTCADYVAETIRANYPDLRVPFHARWRHFVINGHDHYEPVQLLLSREPDERARQRFELAVVSVLLDAGAGAAWTYTWTDQHGAHAVQRSEGLAIASLHAWADGLFSSGVGSSRTDGAGLRALTVAMLGHAFEASAQNPLQGLDGRVALLYRLGTVAAERPDLFGAQQRIGGLYHVLAARAFDGKLPARKILTVLLDAFGPIWPDRPVLDGVHLGDTWRHPAIDITGPTRGLVPFHKLSQWLAYSLIEPLQEAGIEVTGIGDLTGLAEYRNGGLLMDFGVIVPKHDRITLQVWRPGDEPIVEWRALTVVLLDRLAPLVRQRLAKSEAELPLASILEGGTWAAGRRIAAERRPGGAPPIDIVSDGSVF